MAKTSPKSSNSRKRSGAGAESNPRILSKHRSVLLVLALALVLVGSSLMLLSRDTHTDNVRSSVKLAERPAALQENDVTPSPSGSPISPQGEDDTAPPAAEQPAAPPEDDAVPVAAETPEDNTAPILRSAIYDDSAKVLTATFSETLKTPAPPGSAFWLLVDGTYFDTSLISIDGAAVVLTFPDYLTVSTDTPLELFYSPPASDANPLQDPAGNLVVEFSNQLVTCTNKSPARSSPNSKPSDTKTGRCSSHHYRDFSSDPCDQSWQVPCSWTPERGCLHR
ncbi:hypothetical protein F4X86_04320 [Candidatus Saccharibacteria bacterium]|nr:hypothetical protein [Candidatus Saccharibacteria bacterium]